MDQETLERYNLVKEKRVCPQCGSDVRQGTLQEVATKLEDPLVEGEDPESLAFLCTACSYCISVGEKAAS